jgi:hypothetical protein
MSSLEAKLSAACDKLRTDLATASTSQAKTIEDLVEEIAGIHRLAIETGIKAEEAASSSHNAMDATLTATCNQLRKQLLDRCVSLETAQTSQKSAIDNALEQVKVRAASATSAVDDKYAANCSGLRQQLSQTTADLKGGMEDLRTSLAERCVSVETSSHRQIEALTSRLSSESDAHRSAVADLEAKVLEAVSAEQASSEERASRADSKLERRTQDLSAALEGASKTLGSDLQALRQKVDVDLSTQLSTMQSLVDEKMQTSITKMSSQLAALESRLKTELEPKLAEAALVASRANNSVAELKTRVQLDSEELKTGFQKGMQDLAESVGTMEEAVTEVQQMADINSMLMGAAAASPR